MTELTAEQMDLMRSDASAFREAWYAHHISALLSHADALAAKVEHAEARWQKDAMQIDTDFDDLREERDEARAKVATMETLCDSLKEKVARLEGEYRRRRVDDELPQHGALVVAGHDDGFDPSLVTWNEGGEGWEGQNGSFRRRSGFDWWAPIAPGEAEHASE